MNKPIPIFITPDFQYMDHQDPYELYTDSRFEYVDFRAEPCKFFQLSESGIHHWVHESAMEYGYKIFNWLKIQPKNNPILKTVNYKGNDYGYYVSPSKYLVHDYVFDVIKEGDESILTNFIPNRNNIEPYRNSFFCMHSVCDVENVLIKSSEKLLIFCDSMIIPLVPLFVGNFKLVTFLDARYQYDKKHEITKHFKLDDYDFCLGVCHRKPRTIIRYFNDFVENRF